MRIFEAFLLVFVAFSPLQANETLTDEPDNSAYHFTTSYQVEVNAPANKVWTHAINFGSWMVDFDMLHHSGQRGQVGEVMRLYKEQDFFIQAIAMVPYSSITIANLPSTFQGERSTGVGVIHLIETGGKTTVSLTMSRRYVWVGEGVNTMKEVRQTQRFIDGTRNTWKRFLGQLKLLAEKP